MAEYTAITSWVRGGAAFTDNNYSRRHQWEFDGGVVVPASSSPHVVPLPLSAADAVDPEEAFVAALSSCHLLWFLSLAAKKCWIVERYRDEAVGTLARNAEGKLAMTEVTLRPAVQFVGEVQPTIEDIRTLHEEAHALCFIANSVKTKVRVALEE
jgi:organic hydroperoxide reductase OsmC/OhrA